MGARLASAISTQLNAVLDVGAAVSGSAMGMFFTTDPATSKFGIFNQGTAANAVIQQHVAWTGTDSAKLAALGIALEQYGWIIRDL